MTVAVVGTSVGVRRFSSVDRTAVLELIRGDRLPGRPAVTAAVLDQALEQEVLLCEVLVSTAGDVLGAVGWTIHGADGAGVVMWLHCQDDEQNLAEVLIRHVLGQFGRRPVHAFTEPTVLTPIGLPVRNRPGTRRALEGWRPIRGVKDDERRFRTEPSKVRTKESHARVFSSIPY